mmetsp:Transcript_83283/g.193454  ORF Transcript_83283/g.193454 Transcript_83283/m.193454 type:complete len:582 (+) Transcript_83283:75-1820(+)
MLAAKSAAGVLLAVMAARAEEVREYVSYTAAGVKSRGFISYDSSRCTASSKCPGVVIIPDWDGMNQYEMDRACMLSSLGYVAFAADIYGVDIVNAWEGDGTFTDYRTASSMHRQDATLYMGKTVAGIEVLAAYDFVDDAKLGAIGYCFGGTGVINLALAGYGGTYKVPSGLMGVVAYHAGATGLLNATDFTPSGRPQLLVHHGVADGAIPNATMAQMELDLEAVSAIYEVQRYGSGVGHGFTSWGGPAYEARADRRSWSSTTSFFADLFEGYAAPSKPPAPADPMRSESVSYMADGVSCTGFLIYDTSKCSDTSKCPGVLVIQDWNGMNTYEMDRAHMLAALGYVAFAADIYGDEIVNSWEDTPSMNDFINASGQHLQDATLYMSKIVGGLTQLSSYNFVDTTKLAAIGYCFGGTGAINLAIAGHGGAYAVPTGLLGVVAYHSGALGLLRAVDFSPASRPKLYIHQGRSDPAIPMEAMTALEGDMEAQDAEFDIVWYGHSVGHPFTGWGGFAYDARADHRSWLSTESFLSEIFNGTTTGSNKPSQCMDNSGSRGNTESTDAAPVNSLAPCMFFTLLIALVH